MKTELTNRAAVVWAVAFEGSGKSREWQAGALRGLQLAMGEVPPGTGLSYVPGTAAYDAWAAGVQAGMAEGSARVAEGEVLA